MKTLHRSNDKSRGITTVESLLSPYVAMPKSQADEQAKYGKLGLAVKVIVDARLKAASTETEYKKLEVQLDNIKADLDKALSERVEKFLKAFDDPSPDDRLLAREILLKRQFGDRIDEMNAIQERQASILKKHDQAAISAGVIFLMGSDTQTRDFPKQDTAYVSHLNGDNMAFVYNSGAVIPEIYLDGEKWTKLEYQATEHTRRAFQSTKAIQKFHFIAKSDPKKAVKMLALVDESYNPFAGVKTSQKPSVESMTVEDWEVYLKG